ncbi:InlB B-repeat-containing protein [Usitatibacter palustris]|uniref:Cyanovirin-N domain-containing protein n=1 Tax=Usitatibacter palustris TaxID=2732487 RepID=A0A6M4H5Z7_9PROT|nr:hypothetical protein [Usitatibacter palustris]QJR15071.1 hypothetical protein DSM104440_01887 [Usitatibacter palustris]
MTTQWRTTLGLLLAATAAQAQLPPLPPGAPQGSYVSTCSNVKVSGNTLSATCLRANQTPNATTLTLPCTKGLVENLNGVLTCVPYTPPPPSPPPQGGIRPAPAGSYTQTCVGPIISYDEVLRALCANKAGVKAVSELKMPCNGSIENLDGKLTCVTAKAPTPPPPTPAPPVKPPPVTPPPVTPPPPKPKQFPGELMPTTGGAILLPGGYPAKCVPEKACQFTIVGAVELRAAERGGYVFDGWIGACEGRKEPFCVLDKPAKVGATFVTKKSLNKSFTVALLPTQNGAIFGPAEFKTKCVPEKACEVVVPGPVELRAVTRQGFLFAGWVGACEAVKEPVCLVDRSVKVGAKFAAGKPPPPPKSFPVTLLPAVNGVILRPGEVKSNCVPEKGCEIVVAGSEELRAVPRPGYVFRSWVGACEDKKEPVCVVDRPVKVGASFVSTTKPK